MFPVAWVVDQIIKQQHTPWGNVFVQQSQSINGTCSSNTRNNVNRAVRIVSASVFAQVPVQNIHDHATFSNASAFVIAQDLVQSASKHAPHYSAKVFFEGKEAGDACSAQ